MNGALNRPTVRLMAVAGCAQNLICDCPAESVFVVKTGE